MVAVLLPELEVLLQLLELLLMVLLPDQLELLLQLLELLLMVEVVVAVTQRRQQQSVRQNGAAARPSCHSACAQQRTRVVQGAEQKTGRARPRDVGAVGAESSRRQGERRETLERSAPRDAAHPLC